MAAEMVALVSLAAAFAAPFVQEDVAVLGAATVSAMGMGPAWPLALATFAGLTASDLSKYAAGRLAHRWPRAAALAASPKVAAARAAVTQRLGFSIFAARFIPGTRVALYAACGVFRAPFAPFAAWTALSGALYVAAAFGALHLLGAAMGGPSLHALGAIAALAAAGFIAWRWLRHARWAKRDRPP